MAATVIFISLALCRRRVPREQKNIPYKRRPRTVVALGTLHRDFIGVENDLLPSTMEMMKMMDHRPTAQKNDYQRTVNRHLVPSARRLSLSAITNCGI